MPKKELDLKAKKKALEKKQKDPQLSASAKKAGLAKPSSKAKASTRAKASAKEKASAKTSAKKAAKPEAKERKQSAKKTASTATKASTKKTPGTEAKRSSKPSSVSFEAKFYSDLELKDMIHAKIIRCMETGRITKISYPDLTEGYFGLQPTTFQASTL